MPVQPHHAYDNVVAFPVSINGKVPVRPEQFRHVPVMLVASLVSIDGKDVRPKQPYHVSRSENTNEVLINGKLVSFEQLVQAFVIFVTFAVLIDGNVPVMLIQLCHVPASEVTFDVSINGNVPEIEVQLLHAPANVVALVVTIDGKVPVRLLQYSQVCVKSVALDISISGKDVIP